MSAFLISGLSGSGKTSLGHFLENLGYKVIHTDEEPGLSAWINIANGTIETDIPTKPFSEEWISSHRWVWNDNKMNELLHLTHKETVFFCGGAYNRSDYYDRFSAHFVLITDDKTMIKRLQQREPERYYDGSPELQKMLAWNKKIRAQSEAESAIVIESAKPTKLIADEILDTVKGIVE